MKIDHINNWPLLQYYLSTPTVGWVDNRQTMNWINNLLVCWHARYRPMCQGGQYFHNNKETVAVYSPFCIISSPKQINHKICLNWLLIDLKLHEISSYEVYMSINCHAVTGKSLTDASQKKLTIARNTVKYATWEYPREAFSQNNWQTSDWH